MQNSRHDPPAPRRATVNPLAAAPLVQRRLRRLGFCFDFANAMG